MKGFQLDSSGDLVLNGNTLEMVTEEELIRQKVQTVLSTNRKDWFADWDEGIDFSVILCKQPEEEAVKQELVNGLLQVDETFDLVDFNMEFDRKNRILHITFSARNGSGQTIEGVKTWA